MKRVALITGGSRVLVLVSPSELAKIVLILPSMVHVLQLK